MSVTSGPTTDSDIASVHSCACRVLVTHIEAFCRNQIVRTRCDRLKLPFLIHATHTGPSHCFVDVIQFLTTKSENFTKNEEKT